jgi:hypothetical protein
MKSLIKGVVDGQIHPSMPPYLPPLIGWTFPLSTTPACYHISFKDASFARNHALNAL